MALNAESVTNTSPSTTNDAEVARAGAASMRASLVQPFEIEDPRRSEDSSLEVDGRLVGISAVNVRHGFIRKVYCIVGAQLLVTVAVAAAIFTQADKIVEAIGDGGIRALFYASLALTIACMCAFYCCEELIRPFPQNYIILFTFTFFESIMVGFACTLYTGESVLLALGTTCVVVLALTIFACQTKYDFTGAGPYLFAALLVVSCFGFILSIAVISGAKSEAMQPVRIIYASLGALVMSLYIVYDTQLIIGGKHHKIQFSEDDYVFAALNLYIDIVELFLYLLEIFGDRNSN